MEQVFYVVRLKRKLKCTTKCYARQENYKVALAIYA